jgi:hypothetical protein
MAKISICISKNRKILKFPNLVCVVDAVKVGLVINVVVVVAAGVAPIVVVPSA